MTVAVIALAGTCMVLVAWDVVLTAAWVAQRRRHDRLMYRVGTLSKSVTKTSRMRHTGTQSAVTGTQIAPKPLPPFPVPLPNTNPMGRHASS